MEKNYVLDTKGPNLLRVITTSEEMGRLMTCIKGMNTRGWESEILYEKEALFAIVVESIPNKPPGEPYHRLFTGTNQNMEAAEYCIGLTRSNVPFRIYQVAQTEELELAPCQLQPKPAGGGGVL